VAFSGAARTSQIGAAVPGVGWQQSRWPAFAHTASVALPSQRDDDARGGGGGCRVAGGVGVRGLHAGGSAALCAAVRPGCFHGAQATVRGAVAASASASAWRVHTRNLSVSRTSRSGGDMGGSVSGASTMGAGAVGGMPGVPPPFDPATMGHVVPHMGEIHEVGMGWNG
jgi:hypothetical protein